MGPAPPLPARCRCGWLVVDGWHKMKSSDDEFGELWDELWTQWAIIRPHWVITVVKIKAHSSSADVLAGNIQEKHRAGNELADHWAKEGAKVNEMKDKAYDNIKQHDAHTWMIQSRLISVVTNCLKSEKHTKAEKRPRSGGMDDQIKALGHSIQPHTDGYKCDLCGQTWTKRTRAGLLAKGQCPGPGIWGEIQGEGPNRPHQVPRGEVIMYHGAKLHSVHKLAWYRGIVYCNNCGAYGHNRFVGLISPNCVKGPLGSDAHRCLKSIRGGRHPKGKPWPASEDTPAPYVIANLRG